MAYAPIALTIPQYDRTLYANWWLKAYEQGTTTPLAMATDATGGTTAAKFELDSQGFPITSGDARLIPFINGDYDLWLFPTEAEADANDTTNAIQFADNLNADPQPEIVNTIADLMLITGVDDQFVFVLGYYASGDGGGGHYYYDSSSGATHNGGTVIAPTGIVGNGRWLLSDSEHVSVLQFGMKGDDATDNATIMVTMLGLSLRSIYFPSGNYVMSDLGSGSIDARTDYTLNDITFYGDGHDSKIKTNTDVWLVLYGTCSDITIKDIAITSTAASGGTVWGLITAYDATITNMVFDNVYFSAPNVATNGIKIVSENTNRLNDLFVRNCTFENVGQMGVEVQNHTADTTERYFNIVIINNTFKSLGTASTYGMAVSLTGYGLGALVAGNSIADTKDVGLENVGCSNAIWDANRFSTMANSQAAFSFTGARVMRGNRVTNNVMDTACAVGINFKNMVRPVITGNTFLCDTFITMDGVSEGTFANNKVITSGNYALTLTILVGPNIDNKIIGNLLDNSASGANYTVINVDGATSERNDIAFNDLNKGTGGFYIVYANSAQIGTETKNKLDGTYEYRQFFDYNFSSDANVSLDQVVQESEFIRMQDTGVVLTTTRTVTLPDVVRLWNVYNATAQSLTFSGPSGATVTVITANKAIIAWDGSNMRRVTADSP